MKIYLLISILLIFSSQNESPQQAFISNSFKSDSLQLLEMISHREDAMINKDLDVAMAQFTENATWINSQGYYFEGIDEVKKFHRMLADNDSRDYYYEAGTPRIRITDQHNALVYYSWKMFWYKKANKTDTTFKEIGLMTLVAQKQKNEWKWIAVTNQHTPWFYERIDPVKID